GIRYKSVDLDAADFPGGSDFATEVRKALHAKAGTPTIPQIFVSGKHIGGATETFDAFNDGSLVSLLKQAGVNDLSQNIPDAYTFLPKWLHPREARPQTSHA
ncbi:O-acetylserine lyase, partial [Escherichia coli]|nr:O-acetylserine lyase [Escherichia coli]